MNLREIIDGVILNDNVVVPKSVYERIQKYPEVEGAIKKLFSGDYTVNPYGEYISRNGNVAISCKYDDDIQKLILKNVFLIGRVAQPLDESVLFSIRRGDLMKPYPIIRGHKRPSYIYHPQSDSLAIDYDDYIQSFWSGFPYIFKPLYADVILPLLMSVNKRISNNGFSVYPQNYKRFFIHDYGIGKIYSENIVGFITPNIWVSKFSFDKIMQIYLKKYVMMFSPILTYITSHNEFPTARAVDFGFSTLLVLFDFYAYSNVNLDKKRFPLLISYPDGTYTGYMVPYDRGVFTVHGGLDDILSDKVPEEKILITHYVFEKSLSDYSFAEVKLLNMNFPLPNFRMLYVSDNMKFWSGIFYNIKNCLVQEIKEIGNETFHQMRKNMDIVSEFGVGIL